MQKDQLVGICGVKIVACVDLWWQEFICVSARTDICWRALSCMTCLDITPTHGDICWWHDDTY